MQDILENFKKRISDTEKALKNVGSAHESEEDTFDYKSQRARYNKIALGSAVKNLREDSWALVELKSVSKENEMPILKILNLTAKLDYDSKPEVVKIAVLELSKLANSLRSGMPVAEKKVLFADIPELPEGIVADVVADLNEIRKCFEAAAYRSCVILCGRVLETALLRKYFEVTGNDLLETSPGIGLGKILAKLTEKNIQFDPGLTQQIHLINQVRIFSVHIKKEAFYPSKGQAHAIILYTLDVMKKLFA